MNKKFKAFVDLDGVLSNFEKKVSEIIGKDIKTASGREVWSGIYRHDKHVEPFFETLPLMDDAMELWEFVIANVEHVEILTATGTTPRDAPEQKRTWVKNTLTGYKKINTVKSSLNKAELAKPTNILIDDRSASIDPWVKAGGIGILHTSAKDTITQLQELLK